MVQLFYNSSESGVTLGAKVRVLCQMKRVADTDQSFAPALNSLSSESQLDIITFSQQFCFDLVTRQDASRQLNLCSPLNAWSP
jgi:hypothetical protein